MPPTVVREAIAKFTTSDAVPVEVDLQCHSWALDLTSDTEEIDIGTFCAPGASDVGRTTYTAVLAVLWSPQLILDLESVIGVEGVFTFAPDINAPGAVISFNSRISSLPWGRFEVGQRVEADMPLAVLSTPEWIPGP